MSNDTSLTLSTTFYSKKIRMHVIASSKGYKVKNKNKNKHIKTKVHNTLKLYNSILLKKIMVSITALNYSSSVTDALLKNKRWQYINSTL